MNAVPGPAALSGHGMVGTKVKGARVVLALNQPCIKATMR